MISQKFCTPLRSPENMIGRRVDIWHKSICQCSQNVSSVCDCNIRWIYKVGCGLINRLVSGDRRVISMIISVSIIVIIVSASGGGRCCIINSRISRFVLALI
jgi:hypothetical protein